MEQLSHPHQTYQQQERIQQTAHYKQPHAALAWLHLKHQQEVLRVGYEEGETGQHMEDFEADGDLLQEVEDREQRHQCKEVNEKIKELFEEPHL